MQEQDFAASSENFLYIGEFRNQRKRYQTKPSHVYTTPDGGKNFALMACFAVDEQSGDIQKTPGSPGLPDTVYPSFFISIPDEVQGAAFFDKHVVLSQSYGRRNISRLSVYRNPFGSMPVDFFSFTNIFRVPVRHLDGTNHVKTINAPPMTEGIAVARDSLAVLFESGAGKYRKSAWLPQDRIQLLDLAMLVNGPGGSEDG